MEIDKIVVGLDIGTTKICALVGRKNQYGKLEILGLGKAVSDGVTRGMVTNIQKTIDAIQKAIDEAAEQAGTEIQIVNVGIAGQHIRSSLVHGGYTRDSNEGEISIEDVNRLTNDMYKTITPPGSQIIHVMPQDYIVDYEPGIKDPVGMSGVRLEAGFHIITAQATAIGNINKCVYKCNLEIENLILEPIASSLSVLTEEEKEAGVCLVDIGGGTTDVAIFHDNIIRHTAVIPFGGNIITSDIKQGCMVMQNQAELLKVRHGMAIADEASANSVIVIEGLKNRPSKEISEKNLANIIEARVEEIIEMVYSEIIHSGYEKKLAGGIVITGGGSQMKFLKQKFEYDTGLDTRIGLPNEHLGRCKADDVKSPMYATGIGLVLAGFRTIDERENRYNEAKASNANTRRTNGKAPLIGGDFFSKILTKTRNLLVDDDLGDKNNY